MKRILFIMTIVSMGLCACVGGTQDSSSEYSTETKKECCSSEKAEKECCSSKEAKKECSSEENKKECCSSKKDSTQSHDHVVGEDHNHDQNEE